MLTRADFPSVLNCREWKPQDSEMGVPQAMEAVATLPSEQRVLMLQRQECVYETPPPEVNLVLLLLILAVWFSCAQLLTPSMMMHR